jgi:hypothetical protein
MPAATANRNCGSVSTTAVDVLVALDIVFAEIGPDLNFDQAQWHSTLVFKPMDGAQRDMDRLIFRQHCGLPITGHLCGAFNHDPVFGAVVMGLQREFAARSHPDRFYLKPLAKCEAFKMTPWAIFRMRGSGGAAGTVVECIRARIEGHSQNLSGL